MEVTPELTTLTPAQYRRLFAVLFEHEPDGLSDDIVKMCVDILSRALLEPPFNTVRTPARIDFSPKKDR